MRARILGAALAVLVALGGCTAAEPSDNDDSGAGSPTASAPAQPTPSPTASTRLGCDSLLPASRAATALGVERTALEGSRTVTVRSSGELIREAAEENGGLLRCAWYDGDTSITAAAAEDAGAAFAGRPRARLATEVEAYGSCADGSCDVDLLAGTTWVTLQVRGAPATVDLAALATGTASETLGTLDEPVTATAPICSDLLTAEQLTAAAGLAQPTPGAGSEAGAPPTANAAAATRAGYASCSWSDAASGTYSGVTVDALPNGDDGWRNLSLTSGLAIALEPLDGFGEKALTGCAAGVCEIDALADDVWWRVTVTGDATKAEAVARALLANA
ncbi:hypothetical protein [Rathayibacter iranicus]|uniref:DUF3558 domain-containing protein n=4 Tax=Rathayibacter iranicus TaxID=59737 RepID=A0AAD1ENQ1_9MICO|nr:hypothetical protein [Rathayibacter iranicus]AZZ56699.1 hypothetical protein C7V51_13045 [Rathayibacter iranicus]MWV31261.1 hypothetical protein [Rathayibacter iranicus NCPPB 2253 = VKM Ac-1602]PPI58288.1 hypothetical protein C5E08_12880 [Rathayibacter iranicus]PWJ63610.1 hypothetical protein B0H03_10779 [Rathayibacter iranicus NCPPB 2253 = VKM Ac-1602]